MATAAELKAEGNKYFARQKYDLAVQKFTGAIELDNTNAIFYANRSACYLNMERYLDAAADALQATKLDSSYTKAWVRLASAYGTLNMADPCAQAWKKAIDTLPQDDGESTSHLREGYRSQLKSAKGKIAGLQQTFDSHATLDRSAKLPWVVAEELMPKLTEEQKLSSAWSISVAYETFQSGVDKVLKLVTQTNSRGEKAFNGHPQAIDEVVGGIMSDERVFHISADNSWYDKLNNQVIFEIRSVEAESYSDLGPEMVIQKMQDLRRKRGWSPVRQIIRKLVHLWIMHGFIQHKMMGQDEAARGFYKGAVDVLTWGRTNWSDVSYEDKGAVFKSTFFWKVKSMYLEMYLSTISKIEDKRKRQQELNALYREAQSLIDEIDADRSSDDLYPNILISFYMNPRASALCLQAFCHKQTATMQGTQAQSQEYFYKSALKYRQAANIYLPDDDRRPYFLATALNCLWAADKATFRDVKEIMKEFRSSFDEQRKIWASLTSSPIRRTNVIGFIEVEQEALTRLDSGEVTLDDIHHHAPI